ncbi:MAG: hypothetical protein GY841_13430 [FCB group bacterium]|nr:hypothetical protein [FCB group bacterium]
MTAIKSLIVILAILPTGLLAAATFDNPADLFDLYVEALLSEDLIAAAECWLDESIQKSKRLGITYTDVPLKYDCASPLILNLQTIRRLKSKVTVADVDYHDDWALLTIQAGDPTEGLTCYYYALQTDFGWKLAPAIHIKTRSWLTTRTKYANIYHSDKSMINRPACLELDRFIESSGHELGLSPSALNKLAGEGIDYYLCDETEFKALTGYDAHGLGNLQFDAVVTRHLPHEHELTHLLVNYAKGDLPLYTIPFMQEGLACRMGGRWGRVPRVIAYTGHLILSNDMCPLQDILTFDDFHTKVGTPEISYPVSSIFVDYLIERSGMEKVLSLYRHLSGTGKEIRSLSSDNIKAAIEEKCGLRWDDIVPDFAAYWPRFEKAGIVPIEIDNTTEPELIVDSDSLVLSVRTDADSYLFTIMMAADMKSGVVKFGPRVAILDREYQSRLFAEQFPSVRFTGERYGLVFSNSEIGLYDYFCDQVRAKYVSLSPNNGLWDTENGVLNFTLDKTIVGEDALIHLSGRINRP